MTTMSQTAARKAPGTKALLEQLYAAQERRDNAAEQSGLLRAALDHAKVRHMNGENSTLDVSKAEQTYLNQRSYLAACQERVNQLKEQVNA